MAILLAEGSAFSIEESIEDSRLWIGCCGFAARYGPEAAGAYLADTPAEEPLPPAISHQSGEPALQMLGSTTVAWKTRELQGAAVPRRILLPTAQTHAHPRVKLGSQSMGLTIVA